MYLQPLLEGEALSSDPRAEPREYWARRREQKTREALTRIWGPPAELLFGRGCGWLCAFRLTAAAAGAVFG
jgi:hypothetical protein